MDSNVNKTIYTLCLVGICWIATADYPHARDQYFFRLFASFCISHISHQQHKGSAADYLWKNQTQVDVFNVHTDKHN